MGGDDGCERRLDAVKTLLSNCSFSWSVKFFRKIKKTYFCGNHQRAVYSIVIVAVASASFVWLFDLFVCLFSNRQLN